jgi:hypothetical protein
MSNQYFDMPSVKHMFGTNTRLCYACLYPKFEWFDKEFSIEKLIEPNYAVVTKLDIFPAAIDTSDKFLLSSIGFDRVVRKYNMVVELDNDEKFTTNLFENNKEEIILVHENNVTVGVEFDDVKETFYRKIIRIKSDLDFEGGTVLIRDENFETFKNLYSVAYELYPEEVIKTHDKTEKNV